MTNEIDFEKYTIRGAYHWEQISSSIRRHNALVSARYEAVLTALGEVRNLLILDIGGGDGALSYLLVKRGARVVTLDVVPLALHFVQLTLKERGLTPHPIAATAYTLPFPTNTFNAAICGDVIEHVQSPDMLINEAARILQPGGRFVLTTPLRLTEKPIDRMHAHEFFAGELESLLATAFVNVKVQGFAPLFLLELFHLSFPGLRGRPLFRYLFNALAIYLKYNPFTITNIFHYFSMLLATGQKS